MLLPGRGGSQRVGIGGRDSGVTDIECVSADGRSLSPLIIRLVAGY